MAIIKQTKIPAQTEAYFIKKEVDDNGNLVLYFQANDYLPDYGHVLSAEVSLAEQPADYLRSAAFVPNLKFRIKKESVINYPFINLLQDFYKYKLTFAFAPQSFSSGNGGAVAFASLSLIDCEKDEGALPCAGVGNFVAVN